jgi:hypothetical protein
LRPQFGRRTASQLDRYNILWSRRGIFSNGIRLLVFPLCLPPRFFLAQMNFMASASGPIMLRDLARFALLTLAINIRRRPFFDNLAICNDTFEPPCSNGEPFVTYGERCTIHGFVMRTPFRSCETLWDDTSKSIPFPFLPLTASAVVFVDLGFGSLFTTKIALRARVQNLKNGTVLMNQDGRMGDLYGLKAKNSPFPRP